MAWLSVRQPSIKQQSKFNLYISHKSSHTQNVKMWNFRSCIPTFQSNLNMANIYLSVDNTILQGICFLSGFYWNNGCCWLILKLLYKNSDWKQKYWSNLLFWKGGMIYQYQPHLRCISQMSTYEHRQTEISLISC